MPTTWILTINADDGMGVTAHATEALATKALRAYADEHWSDEADGVSDDDLHQFVADRVPFYLNEHEIEVDEVATGNKIEILHVRDPDSECATRVWVDGVELTEFTYLDLDPGRGHVAEDWDKAHREAIANPDLSGSYRLALDQAYIDGRDSEYVEDLRRTPGLRLSRFALNNRAYENVEDRR
jgi:hypothetical protein